MSEEAELQKALEKIAKRKLAAYQPQIEEQGKRLLRKADLDEENVGRMAAIAKLASDISQGQLNQDFGNLKVKAKMTPEERAIMFGYKTDF